MKNLIQAEWLKLRRQRGFHFLLLLILANIIIQSLAFGYGTDPIWPCGYSWYFNFSTNIYYVSQNIAIFTGIFIAGGFADRTFGMAFFNGCSRMQIIIAKFVIYFAGAFCIWFITVCIGPMIVSLRVGFVPAIEGGVVTINYITSVTFKVIFKIPLQTQTRSGFAGSWVVLPTKRHLENICFSNHKEQQFFPSGQFLEKRNKGHLSGKCQVRF